MDGERQQYRTGSSGARPPYETVQPDRRKMVRAELLGQHSHQTICGKNIHIWQRAWKFIARGYINGKQFGETLGTNKNDATARLRRLMVGPISAFGAWESPVGIFQGTEFHSHHINLD